MLKKMMEGTIALAVAIGADKQHVLLRAGREHLHEVERTPVEPLQIIEKDGEWLAWVGMALEFLDQAAMQAFFLNLCRG